MYDEMTISDLLVTAHQQAHPEDQPSAEHALLIDELSRRLRRLDIWRSKVSAEINSYLTDDDGSDLIPEHERIRFMLQRLSSARLAPAPAEGEVGMLVADLQMMASQAVKAWQYNDAESLSRTADLLLQQEGRIARAYQEGRRDAEADSQQASESAKDEPSGLEQRHPAPAPVPVSKRLPGPEDCDGEGRVWWLGVDTWMLRSYALIEGTAIPLGTHWLPATALPVPRQGEI